MLVHTCNFTVHLGSAEMKATMQCHFEHEQQYSRWQLSRWSWFSNASVHHTIRIVAVQMLTWSREQRAHLFLDGHVGEVHVKVFNAALGQAVAHCAEARKAAAIEVHLQPN